MNFNQKNQIERELISLIKREGSQEGSVKICLSSMKHETVKFQATLTFKKNGFKTWNECPFVSPFSGRSDIFAVKGNIGYIAEILESESDKDFEEKIKTYPEHPNLTIIKVKTSEFNPETWCF
jgi:hypothetical protein